MQLDINKDTMFWLYEAINRGNYPALDHIFSRDYLEHASLCPSIASNFDGAKEYIRMLHRAFPDVHFDILDMVADNDKVWCRILMTGTQREEFDGIPATGKRVQIERIDIYRFAQNRIVEHWCIVEELVMFQQLGEYLTQEAVE